MKKVIIGAVVGGIIIFICQTLSWTILDLHRPAAEYTPKQEEILSYLNSNFSSNGQYFLPNYPAGASMEEANKLMETSAGKPWAVIAYHKEMKTNMGSNIMRVILVNILMVGLFCWMIAKMSNPKFSTVFLASLFLGLIVFLNIPYTTHIWYETFDLSASLIDALVGWGLCGLWLGWLYGKK